MSSNFFRGTTAEQDSRWGDADKKLLRRTKFSKVLEQKVNMKKVNMDVMQRWIAQRITSLLGFEDDIVVGTCVNYLSEEGKLDPKKLQLQLTGFLEKSTGMFMEELWGLLVDAQTSLGGIPSAFLQDKKEELLQKKEQELKQEEELRRRMLEHQQELENAAALPRPNAAATQDADSSSAIALQRPGGRRASRWGVSQLSAATTPAEELMSSIAPSTIGDESILDTGDRSPSDRSTSRHDGGDFDRRREKRKSKKSKGKKSKKHRRSPKNESVKSGDEGTSSEEDGEGAKSAEDVEESLRQTLLATMKGRRTHEDT